MFCSDYLALRRVNANWNNAPKSIKIKFLEDSNVLLACNQKQETVWWEGASHFKLVEKSIETDPTTWLNFSNGDKASIEQRPVVKILK